MAGQIKDSCVQIERDTSEYGGQIDGITQNLREMEGNIALTGKKASASQTIARSVKRRTVEGSKVIQKLVNSMQSIQQANSNLSTISDIILGNFFNSIDFYISRSF